MDFTKCAKINLNYLVKVGSKALQSMKNKTVCGAKPETSHAQVTVHV
jgi:hypothetical protein